LKVSQLKRALNPKRKPARQQKLTNLLDEELIKHGWEEDVWFHVDNLSSAHIYVRLPDGETWDKISEPLLIDCAQLTKANSIEGASIQEPGLRGAKSLISVR
jgi:NFACT protein RNA binding domain